MDQQSFAAVIGNLMRSERRARSKTLKEVVGEMPDQVSPRTLEGYESGRGKLSLLRFVQICQVQQSDPADVLARATNELGVPDPTDVLVDLRKVLADDTKILAPLRNWAALLTSKQEYGSPVLWRFTPSAIDAMAELCGASSRKLRILLRFFELRLVVDGGLS